jgi:hypothetical protein
LYDFQNLPALGYGVVICVKNLHLRTQLDGGLSGGGRLFEVIRVLVGKGYDKVELLHGRPPHTSKTPL